MMQPRWRLTLTHGYVGKPKGLRQVLFKRGWLKPGGKYTMRGVLVNSVIDQTSSLVTITRTLTA